MSITLHETQSTVFRDLFVDRTCRHAVVVASRGYGKSWLAATAAIAAVFELLALEKHVPNKNVYIIAPTYTQVTDIYYPMINYQMGMEHYATKSSKDLGMFWFPNDVKLKLVSYEAIERIRGTGAYFVVLDEVSSWTKGVGLKSAWQAIIQPCVTTRWSKARAQWYKAPSPGRSLTISTPKGFNFLYDMSNYQEVDPAWKSYHYDYTSSPFLDVAEIEALKHTIDPIEFSREYLANFEDSGNQVFYCFDRKLHVSSDFPEYDKGNKLEKGEDVHIAMDFNVSIQASSFWVLRGKRLYCIGETKGHPDTETLAIAIKAKFPYSRLFAYPDPSGRSRKTSAPVGVTDFSILENAGIHCNAHRAAPPIIDSVNAVNRKLKTVAGDIGITIHPSCNGVITSLERTAWVDNNADTATIDKSQGVEHFSDGIRYMVEYMFPLQTGTNRVSRGFNF